MLRYWSKDHLRKNIIITRIAILDFRRARMAIGTQDIFMKLKMSYSSQHINILIILEQALRQEKGGM